MISNELDFITGNQPQNSDQQPQQQQQTNQQQQQFGAPPNSNFVPAPQIPTYSTHHTVGEYASIIHGGFPGEPSLFEELGIHNSDIKNNLRTILLPNKAPRVFENNIFVCIFFFVAYAFLLLLLKRPRFSTVYMVALFGFIVLYFIMSNMHKNYITNEGEASKFGIMTLLTPLSYCIPLIFPVVAITRLFGLSIVGTSLLSLPFIGWASFCASRYLLPIMKNGSIELLFVPVSLFYAFLLFIPLF